MATTNNSMFGGNLTFDHRSQEWSIFRSRFSQFCVANGITEEIDKSGATRRAILLTAFVEDTYRVIRDLAFPAELDAVEYKSLLTLLDAHFSPKKSTFAERYAFYKAEQRPGEDLAEWAARVRSLAKYCGFKSELDTALRDRFVLGLENTKEKERLFAESVETLSFNKALELAQGVCCARQAPHSSRREPVSLRSQSMQCEPARGRRTPRPSPSGPPRIAKPCDVCGYTNHVREQCRFINYSCTKCHKRGHLKRMCKMESKGFHYLALDDDDVLEADSDHQRRALIRQKTDSYLAHAEALYDRHLAAADIAPPPLSARAAQLAPLPARLLRRPYSDLARYRVLGVLADSLLLVLQRPELTRHVIKVLRKIPNNLTEFDEYFHNRPNETKQPILPTNIPYMVALDCYIETPDLIFLVLQHSPGQKLFDYIQNYVQSLPNSPARELNLENVFTEPLSAQCKDFQNSNDSERVPAILDGNTISIVDRLETNVSKNNNRDNVTNKTDDVIDSEISVNELVINSQKLLLDVSKVLNEEPKTVLEESGPNVNGDKGDAKENVQLQVVDETETIANKINEGRNAVGTPRRDITQPVPRPRDALPPSVICKWAAQILTALESLHNCGVIVRDLHPGNILLGRGGQALLTYCVGYPPGELPPPLPPRRGGPSPPLHVAPELLNCWAYEGEGEGLDYVCDFWSFGAILYELICGVPLCQQHGGGLARHSLLRLPRGLGLEAETILAQLLTPSPAERLGARGISEIKQHPYFKNINWEEIYDNWLMPD